MKLARKEVIGQQTWGFLNILVHWSWSRAIVHFEASSMILPTTLTMQKRHSKTDFDDYLKQQFYQKQIVNMKCLFARPWLR